LWANELPYPKGFKILGYPPLGDNIRGSLIYMPQGGSEIVNKVGDAILAF